MSIEKLFIAAVLGLLAPWGEIHAQGGAGAASKIRSASFRTWEPGLFDPPVLSPAAPWRAGDQPDAVRGPLPRTRDGAHGSAAVAVGEFQWEATDLVVRGRGPDFVLARKYRNKSKERGVLGRGWTHAYEPRVERVGLDLVLHDGWGRRDLFELEPDGAFGAKTWLAVVTEEPDGSVQMRLGPFANVWSFSDPDEPVSTAGMLTRIEDQYGNALTFAYDANGDLDEVVDTLGRTIDFVHDSQRRLSSVTDFAGRTVQYEYYAPGEGGGNPGDLKSVTSPPVVGTPTGNDFPDGKTTTYTYTSRFADTASNHNLTTIRNPDGSLLLRNRYGRGPTVDGPRDWLVGQWHAPAAHEYQLHYLLWRSGMACIVNDEAGNVREYAFDEARRTVRLRHNTGRANPDTETTTNTNRPQNPLRPGEGSFLTTWRLNPDGRVLIRRDEGNGDARIEIYRYELSDEDRTRHGNLLQFIRGSADPSGQRAVESYGYDAPTGVLYSRTLPEGQSTRYLRDPQTGSLTSIVHAEPGVFEDFEYNAFGQLTAYVHADNGNGQRQRDEFVYYDVGPATGYLRWFRENAQHAPAETLYRYDLTGHVTAIVDPVGNATQFAVNALGQVVQVAEPALQLGSNQVIVLTDYLYNLNDNVAQVLRDNIDEDGNGDVNAKWDLTVDHDSRGRTTSVSREFALGQYMTTDFEFLPASTVIRLPRVAEGLATHVVTEEYDERGLLFRRTRGTGHSTDQSTLQWDYDAFGGLQRSHGPLEGNDPDDLCVLANDFGWILSVMDALGNSWNFEYDLNGNRTRATREGELVDVPGTADNVRLKEARWVHDDMDRVVGYQEDWFDPADQTPIHTGQYHFQLEIAGTGELTQLTDPTGEIWSWTRDLATRRTTRTDPAGQTLRETRDERGNVTERLETVFNQLAGQFEAYPTLFAYDEWNRRVEIRDRQQNSWRTLYDSHSRPVVELGPSGLRTERSFDGRGLLLEERVDLNGNGQTTDTADRMTNFAYDLAGNLSARTDDNGNTTFFRYDALDRPLQTIYPDLTSWVRTYDRSGNPVQIVDGNGSVIGQQFDLLGRLTVRTIQPGTGVSNDTLREDYAYDGLSRRVRASDEDSDVVLAHSSLGHLLRETQNGFTTTTDYDALGNPVSCTYPNGRLVSYANDALGRVTSVTEGAAGPVLSTLLYADDQVARRTLVNGVRTDYEFNGIGNTPGDLGVRQLERASHEVVGGASLSELTWTYQGDQASTARFDSRLFFEHDFLRDSASRLVQWDRTIAATTESIQYTLDGIGNRTLVTGGPDAGSYFMNAAAPIPADHQQNQYTATPFDARRYDEIGNTTDWSDAVFVRELVYDYRGRLVEWSDAATGTVHRYTYDALDRMTSHIRDVTGTPTRVTMHYRQHQRIEEFGTALTTYTYEGDASHPFERRDGIVERYYLRDLDDTVRALVDETAAVEEYYDYDPFGNATVRDGSGTLLSGSAHSRTPLFRGMRWHEELELYRDAGGFHDPRTGRDFDGAPSTVDDREPGLPGVTVFADINRNSEGRVDGQDFLVWQTGRSSDHPDFAWIPTANEPTRSVGAALSLTVGASQAEDDDHVPIEIIALDLRGDSAFDPLGAQGTTRALGTTPTLEQAQEDDDVRVIQVDSWSFGVPINPQASYLKFRFENAQLTSFSLNNATGMGPTPAFQATNTGQTPYYQWQLEPARIVSYSVAGSGQSESGLVIGRLWNGAEPPAGNALPDDRRPPMVIFTWGTSW